MLRIGNGMVSSLCFYCSIFWRTYLSKIEFEFFGVANQRVVF